MNLGHLSGLFCLECGKAVRLDGDIYIHADSDRSHHARIAEELIKVNSIVTIVRRGEWIYKRQPSFLAENEWYCLQELAHYEIVPESHRVDLETIRMRYIEEARVVNWDALMGSAHVILGVLKLAGIRHGDLTRPNIRLLENRIMVLDFSESRLACDPRPDKRKEGDSHWLLKTINDLRYNRN